MPMDWDEQDVMLLDGDVHTADCPYCDDPECWCHTDVSYHDVVTHPTYLDADVEQAYSFYGFYR